MKQQKKNWPAESNMTALKTLSHTLLHLDIQPTKMSPLVVKHPFTDSGLAGIYAEDGSLSVGNLLDSPDALRTWRENFSRRINEAETAMNLFCMITKPYQFGYLRLAAAHLSEQDTMVRDGLVFKDEDGQVIFNQYSFCELVKHLLVELVGISYEEASQIVERSPLAEPVADAMGVAIFSHDLPYYWAMFFYYGNGYWQKGIPAQPEDMDAYKALENKIMEKYDLKEPFIWT